MIKTLHFGLSNHLGGIETYLKKITDNIDKDNFSIDFVIQGSEKPCFYDELSEMGCHFYFVTPRRVSLKKNRQEIKTIINEGQYDLLHCHLNSLSYIEPVLIGVEMSIPTIVHSRNAGIKAALHSRILHKMNYYRLPKDKIHKLAVSDKAGDWMFGSDDNFTVLNNGINLNQFQYEPEAREALRKELGIEEDERLLINVGALRTQKNQGFLVDILKSLLEKDSRYKLIIVGAGNLESKLKEKIEKVGLGNQIQLLGKKDNVGSYLSASDIFLFPSFYEGFPNAALEAQSTGINCIISDTITKEVDINPNVKYCSIDNVDSWIDSIQEADLSYDRSQGVSNIKNAGFSVEDEIKKLETIYTEIKNNTGKKL